MTRTDDIERVLDRFYADGPSEMPDRLLLSVLDRIERIPQRRLASLTRFDTMRSTLRFAVAAAVIVAIAGISAYVLSNMPGTGAQPTPTPSSTSAAASGQPSLGPVPQAFQSTWFGEVIRPIAGPPSAQDRSGFKVMGSGFVYYYSSAAPIFQSTIALAAPNVVQLTLSVDGFGCHLGDIGQYRYTLSPSQQTMTLSAVSDECAQRSVGLSGPWSRVGCTGPADSCLGVLDPGSHVATIFTPFVPAASWAYDQGRFTYTVPVGWSNTADGFGNYHLDRTDEIAHAGISVFDDVVAHSQAKSCPETAEPGVGRSARAIATWLTTLPGLVSTAPAPVTVGGLSGFQLDVSVAAGWTHTCSFSGGQPIVSTFTDSDPAAGFDWNVAGSAHARYILLDIGDGRTMVISVDADNQAAWTSLVEEATPIIASFQFLH